MAGPVVGFVPVEMASSGSGDNLAPKDNMAQTSPALQSRIVKIGSKKFGPAVTGVGCRPISGSRHSENEP
jgi:hypothetical protein